MKTLATLAVATLFLLSSIAFAANDDTVSFNHGSKEQLMSIPGARIPEQLVKSIIDFRTKNGPFKTESDLLKVPGMNERWLNILNPTEKNGDLVFDPDAPPRMHGY